jgi:hypothetical protein
MLRRRDVPADKFRLIASVHNSHRGHFGIESTVRMLTDAGHVWPKMTDHVTAFKEYCPVCQKASERGVNINIEPFTTATLTPMKRINVDTIGPLPASEDG